MVVSKTPQLRVLVVDDDELNRRMMRLILSREEHHVELASDGFEACRLAEDTKYDIILMDLQMPEMDGVETSRRIRALENGSRDSYIVALTASFLPEKGQELFEAGIDNYIAKPFDVEHLRQMLNHGLDHHENTGSYDAAAMEMDISELINEQIFDPKIGLIQIGGDQDAFHELLADFVGELPQRLAEVKKCLIEKDMDGISINAHNLKGVAANLGGLQLSQHASRLENSTGAGYTDSVRLDVDALEKAAEEFVQVVSDFLGAGN